VREREGATATGPLVPENARVTTVPSGRLTPAGALDGVRGLLLDLDGVLIVRNEAFPPAVAALESLRARGIPFRVMTNTSSMSRATLHRWGKRAGLDVPADQIISSLSATAAFTARAFPGEPLYVLASEDARTEFEGQHLLTHAAAGSGDARAAAVVIGDSPEDVTYDTLNRAFRLVQGGAQLIGMHRNRWWVTPEGPRLDSGAIVAGLEYATEQAAVILGKPARQFFMTGVRDMRSEIGAPRLRVNDVAMVGDDLWSDVLGAQRVGLRGVLVLSGKHGAAEVERAARQRRGGGRPDAVAPSLAEVVAALD
jgi:HAD superfamily hydrolase (TIGR01458 family)